MNIQKTIFAACLLLTLAWLHPGRTMAQGHRKKVGVVLSGGGAKGVAHAKALKVIEEAGIPVDIVVGTSMGALVGGLYASGYNADQLDSIINAQEWKTLLMDKVDRRKKDYISRQQKEPYMLTVSFDKSPFEAVKGGLLKGNNVAMLLTELTADHQQEMSYDDLPIRFACVAADIIKDEEVVLHHGVLAESMRASMAIPGVFAPVRKDGMILVDGGIQNNFPVDVARSMGADVVIGVSLHDPQEKRPDQIETPIDVAMQIVDNLCLNKQDENVAQTDVFIHVPVAPYTAASFNKEAIDTLMARGEAAARAKWDELVALRRTIGLSGPPADICRPRKHVPQNGPVVPPSTIYNASQRASYLGVGARFDSEELAALLLGGMYQFNPRNQLRAGLNIRLGERTYFNFTGSVKAFGQWTLEARYMLGLNTLEVYDFGTSALDLRYVEHLARLGVSRGWRKMKVSLGAEFDNKRYTKVNTHEEYVVMNQLLTRDRSVSYNAVLEYDDMDEIQYPHKGMNWNVRYDYYTDNGYGYDGDMGLNIIAANFKIAVPLTSRTTLTPYASFRTVSSRTQHLSNMNFIGGVNHNGFYLPQQFSFAGVGNVQVMDHNLLIAGLQLRQRIMTNHYVFGVFNALTTGEKFGQMFDEQHYGFAVGYGYRTPVGPIEANFNWSDITHSVGFYIGLGYNF